MKFFYAVTAFPSPGNGFKLHSELSIDFLNAEFCSNLLRVFYGCLFGSVECRVSMVIL